jgi:hypothetical protein
VSTDCWFVGLTSLEQSGEKESIVYPNPGKGLYAVKIKGQLPVSMELFDGAGALLRKKETEISELTVFDIQEFAPGIYFVKLHYGNHTEIIRLVKE